jgi:hypothetical protein
MTGEQRLGLPDATRALADLADAEALQAHSPMPCRPANPN